MGIERKVTSIRLDEDLIAELKIIAQEENRPLSNLIETILKKHTDSYKKVNAAEQGENQQ